MRPVLAAAALAVVLLTVYLPGIGHGFIRDDFRWIRESRVETLSQAAALFTTNVGFYRPLVALSFAGDHAVWGLEPFGYGLTNLTLLLASAILLFTLVRQLGLPTAAAVVATGVFVLNFHGVNMALLWLSGRTSLLALLFALSSASAMLRGYGLVAGILCLGALLSKEEVLALPAVLTVFVWKSGGRPLRTWPLWASLVIYAALRSTSGAITPATAPDYYRLSLAPALLLRNAAEYADRAGTLSVAVSLVMLLLVRGTRQGRPSTGPAGWFSDAERRALMLAGLWVPAMYALTVLLPIRSSLYALVPSAGCALVAGVFASRALRSAPVRFGRAAVVLLVVAAALVPVYWRRNERWIAPADLSRHVLESLQATTSSFPAGGRVVLVDAPDTDIGLDEAFDQLFPDALALYAGEQWSGAIVQPGTPVPVDERTLISYELRDGTLEPLSVRRR